ncbi:MAG: helix-turn-helix domain-containing protein [Chloroflexota bacterium]|nr:helix-turn-helix domain-containing protein [Chloroflexota bacterium]
MPTLAAARADAGLSQPALAALAGVSTSTINRIERGRTRPCPRVVTHLSIALGVRPESIVEFRPIALRTRLPEPSVRATGP